MASEACTEIRGKPYPSDVCDEEWSLPAPYLTLLPEDAGQREHSLREVFNGLRYIVKLPEAKRGFVLLPRRRVVERSSAWATRLRRLVKDCERYAKALAGPHLVAFATIMSTQAISLMTVS